MGQTIKSTILFLGSSGAGKTSIIKFCENNYKPVSGDPPQPSVGHSVRYIKDKSVEFTAFDISGQTKYQDLWAKYYKEVDGIVWVIDSTNDENELEEVKEMLQTALQSTDLRQKPFLVVCNKQDASDAKKPDELAEILELSKLLGKRTWKNVGCSTVSGDEIHDG
eukprot:gene10644-3268_t